MWDRRWGRPKNVHLLSCRTADRGGIQMPIASLAGPPMGAVYKCPSSLSQDRRRWGGGKFWHPSPLTPRTARWGRYTNAHRHGALRGGADAEMSGGGDGPGTDHSRMCAGAEAPCLTALPRWGGRAGADTVSTRAPVKGSRSTRVDLRRPGDRRGRAINSRESLTFVADFLLGHKHETLVPGVLCLRPS